MELCQACQMASPRCSAGAGLSESLSSMSLFLSSMSAQELQKYEQFIFADYTSVIQVENVYEEILYQTLLEEALKGEDILEVTVITSRLLACELFLPPWLFQTQVPLS